MAFPANYPKRVTSTSVHRPRKPVLVLRFYFLSFLFLLLLLLSNTVRFDDLNGHGATCYLRRVPAQKDEENGKELPSFGGKGISVDFCGKKLENRLYFFL